MKPVIYVVVNKSLNMSPGKVAAQVGHATALVCLRYSTNLGHEMWINVPHRWLIVLEANDSLHLYHIERYLDERKVRSHAVIDEGANEIPALSMTALGVGILDKDTQEAAYLNSLKTYKWDHTAPSRERTEIWNEAILYLDNRPNRPNRPWWKRLFGDSPFA